MLPGLKRNPRILDLSRTVNRLPESSEPFVFHRSKRREASSAPSYTNSSQEDQSVDSPMVDLGEEEERGPEESDFDSESDGGAGVEIEIEVQGHSEDEDEQGDPENEPTGLESEESAQPTNERLEIDEVEGQELDGDYNAYLEEDDSHDDDTSDSESHALVDDGDDAENEGTEDSISFTSFYSGESICGNEPQYIHKEDALCNDLPCPILHTSVRNIYLLQPSNKSLAPGPNVPPMIGLANPLRQSIQQDFEYLRMFERLNMCTAIPALGVVVCASQKGRALVLALTKIPSALPLLTNILSPASQAERGQMTYAMRAECILPFANQEKENRRPFAPLHGIAAGPVQGSDGVGGRREGMGMGEGRRRWRLMMMYQDHSVLSYEISRRSKKIDSEDGEIDVESLVV